MAFITVCAYAVRPFIERFGHLGFVGTCFSAGWALFMVVCVAYHAFVPIVVCAERFVFVSVMLKEAPAVDVDNGCDR